MYRKLYQNPQANTYNYTGLTAHVSTYHTLIIVTSGWNKGRPTGLAICDSASNPDSYISRVEFNNSIDYSSHLSAFAFLTEPLDIFVFDRRATVPTDINYFYLHIWRIPHVRAM